MTPQELRDLVARSIDPRAFEPLTNTFDYPERLREQTERQTRARDLASQRLGYLPGQEATR